MQNELQRFYEFDWSAAEPVDLFQTKSRASLIGQVAGEVFAGCNLLTIRGCRGVGKTHIGRHLVALLRAHGYVVVCASGAVHSAAQVQSLLAQANSKQPLALLVDDAKACPAALFTYLWSLVARRRAGVPPIQVVLLGDVGPWPGLNEPGLEDLREATTSCYILVPFEDDDAAAYVRHKLGRHKLGRHKLGRAGWRRAMDRRALRHLVGQSHGVPAVLDALVFDAQVQNEKLRKRRAVPAKRPTDYSVRARSTPRRPAIAFALTVTAALTVALAASAIAPSHVSFGQDQAPGSLRLLSAARLPPAQTVAYTSLAQLPSQTVLANFIEPVDEHAGRGGPGLVLVAAAGDDMRMLYDKVYRGVTPPPFPAVLAVNRSPLRPGGLVMFPEPPHGWSSR